MRTIIVTIIGLAFGAILSTSVHAEIDRGTSTTTPAALGCGPMCIEVCMKGKPLCTCVCGDITD